MATTIVTKNGTGAPTDSDLVAGELAVDLTNGRLYTTDLDTGGTVLELGTNPASDVTFGDNTKAIFGAGSDLQIYHDASDSIINDNGTGSLKLQQGGSTKLEVTATGVDVTGTLTTTGSVGIGTSSPDGQFESAHTNTSTYSSSTIKNDFIISRRNSSNVVNQSVGLQFDVTGWSGSTTGVAGITAIQPSNASSADLAFTLRKDGTYAERMRITSDGNVGINATTIAANGLQIGNTSSTDTEQLFLYSNKAIFSINTDGATNAAGTTIAYSWANGGQGPLKFDNATSTVMTLDASGNLGIGTVNPRRKIEVSGVAGANVLQSQDTADSTNFLRMYADVASGAAINVNTGGVIRFCHSAEDFTSFSEAMRIDSSGNLLVGCTGTTVTDNGIKLFGVGSGIFGSIAQTKDYSSGTITYNYFETTNGTVVGSISYNGSLVAYNTSSDQRLKENIVDAPSASDDIDAIQVRSFDWKADGSHQKYGMVAQELQTVAPEAVSAPEDPEEMMGVDYSKLVPMLVKEIQSLRARVAQLES
jgi:hypothetical protein